MAIFQKMKKNLKLYSNYYTAYKVSSYFEEILMNVSVRLSSDSKMLLHF
jgi:hypothetical protein